MRKMPPLVATKAIDCIGCKLGWDFMSNKLGMKSPRCWMKNIGSTKGFAKGQYIGWKNKVPSPSFSHKDIVNKG